MLKLVICILCLMVSLTAHAKLYKIIGGDGSITYTDMAPSMDATDYKLSNINTIGNPAYNMTSINMRIPYSEESGVMMTSGFVNGIAMKFIIDTGASLLAIPPSIAKQAKLLTQPTQNITVQTANGAVNVPKVTIGNLKVATVSQTNIEATVQSVSTNDSNLGLLGMAFFNKYKITIDDKKKEIQLVAK